MGRIRTIKPEFFEHFGLFEAERDSGLPLRAAFPALWTCADREGRFRWRPKQLKLHCLPYDDVDMAHVLDALATYGFIVRYSDGNEVFGYIPSWEKHQKPNHREAASTLPDPAVTGTHGHAPDMPRHAQACPVVPMHVTQGINVTRGLRETVFSRDGHKCQRCGTADDLTVDHIFPLSMGGTHALSNTRCLCRRCNSARPVGGEALVADLLKDGLTLDDMPRLCMPGHARGELEGELEREGEQEDSLTVVRESLASARFVRTPSTAKAKFGPAKFDEFWAAYPAKVAKGAAHKAFVKAGQSGDVEFDDLMAGVERYKRNKPRWQEWSHPASWLNKQRWSDEYDKAANGETIWMQTA